MKPKPINPYERLKREFREYASAIEYPHTKVMWRYPKERLHEGWTLANLAERVAAAEQIGYDVILQSDDEGLRVIYRKKRPSTPWEARS